MLSNDECSRIRGTVEDTELIDGMVFNQKAAGTGGPHRVEKAKIGLIQFCISPPKTDVSTSLSSPSLIFPCVLFVRDFFLHISSRTILRVLGCRCFNL